MRGWGSQVLKSERNARGKTQTEVYWRTLLKGPNLSTLDRLHEGEIELHREAFVFV